MPLVAWKVFFPKDSLLDMGLRTRGLRSHVWIYGLCLAVVLPFIQPRPRYFAEVMANLLFWIGPDKMLFGSDYALWEPKWLVEKLWAFQMPEDLKAEFGVDMTEENKRKILGLNAARLYGINPEEHMAKVKGDTFSQQAEQLYAVH